MGNLKLLCKRKKIKMCASNQYHEEAEKSYLNMWKKRFMGLKEPISFDNIQRCFCTGIYFLVVCEIYNVIVFVRSVLSPSAR